MANERGAARHTELAVEVDRLLALAKKCAKSEPSLAKKYVATARKLAMRRRMPLGRKRRMEFCRECGMPWIAGFNVVVRVKSREKKMEYACKCGAKKSFSYSKKA